jgi:micrococcal nuclease
MSQVASTALRSCIAALLIVLFSTNCFAARQPGSLRYVDPGELFVVDGDTVVYHGAYLRLLNIQAPELHAICEGERTLGLHAREVLVQELANAKSVRLRFYYSISRYGGYRLRYLDKYGRALVDVFVNGVNVVDTLIGQNLAVAWGGEGSKPNWCGRGQ